MDVYLMQHGICFGKEEDPEQPLTPEGTEQIRVGALAMRALGIRPALLVASTKRRALQTARIVAELLGYDPAQIVETDLLKPTAPAEEALDFLGRYRDRPSIFVAGHLPSLREIASLLLTGGSNVVIDFKNGGLCAISAETLPGYAAQLEFFLTPRQLEMVAEGRRKG